MTLAYSYPDTRPRGAKLGRGGNSQDHGYAYGESIVGAEPAPLGAYVAGFALVQYGIAVISGAALGMIVARDYLSETTAMRTAGAAIAFVAGVSFANIALG